MATFSLLSTSERRAWFNKEVLVNHLPKEILPGDLLCGARFNVYTSRCLNEQEAALSEKEQNGARGQQLRAMMTASEIPKEMSAKYADLCQQLAQQEADPVRKGELLENVRLHKNSPPELIARVAE